MIDIASENVLSLSNATAHLPRRRKGSRPHISTLYRWAQRGLCGVKLEVVQVGGTCCTSVEALQRFFDRLSGDGGAPMAPNRKRVQEVATAERECEAAGI